MLNFIFNKMKKAASYSAIFILLIMVLTCKKDEQSLTPVASFTCDKVTGDAPLTVVFTSTSTGTINTYIWDFGDGDLATSQKPTHTYNSSGTYTATLSVTGPGGSNSTSKTITVSQSSYSAPVANFTCDVMTGIAPLTVNFTSTSTGTITAFLWDFGDGGTSTIQNPSHLFSNAGNYTVILTVTGPGGSNSMSKTITVTQSSSSTPVASFTTDVSSGAAPLTVNFTSTSTGNITSYSWSFGDGGTSTAQNPSHTYYSNGTYSASLTVSGPNGSNSTSKTITVSSSSQTTNVTFNNPIFTDIYVTLNGTTQTITPGSSVTFYSVPGSSVSYTAYTSGLTTSNTQIGLKLTWSNTITLTGSTASYNLIVTSEYFFIYITNSGTHTMNNLYVNYGLTSQTLDNIEIPNNSTKYRTGYYKAYTNSNVRMYYKDATTYYTYWNQGTHFTLPWTNNQVANLSNTIKSNSVFSPFEISNVKSINVSEVFHLIPAQPVDFTKDTNAIDLYCN